MRWMTRRRPGYGFAVIIGVLFSAWAHDFGAWCWQVVPLFGFAHREPLALAKLIVPEPPPPVAIEAMPKWKTPASPAAKRDRAPGDGLVLKKKRSREQERGLLAILGSSKESELASVFGSGGLENGMEGVALGGLVGRGEEGDAIGVGGLGLRGTGAGGGGSGGLAGIGELRAGGGGGDGIGIGTLGHGGGTGRGYGVIGTRSDDRARTEWEQRVRQELQRRWKAKMPLSDARPTLFARLELDVGRDGVVRRSAVLRSTGDPDADATLLEAISAQPLPAPPEEAREQDGVVRIVSLTLMLPR